MIDPEQAAAKLNSYESTLKSAPDAREITAGMSLIRDQKEALLKEISNQGLVATLVNGKWEVRSRGR